MDFKISGSRVRAGGEPVRDCPALAHDGIRVGISIAEKRLSRNRAYCITAETHSASQRGSGYRFLKAATLSAARGVSFVAPGARGRWS